MSVTRKAIAHLGQEPVVEFLPGLFRTTLAYHEASMLCHFRMKAGARVPQHTHVAVQNGFVISGKLEFFKSDGTSLIAEAGCAYCFDSNEEHGSVAHEDAEFIEFFAPLRPEYVVEGKE